MILDHQLKIKFSEAGGFAGLTKNLKIDSSRLTTNEIHTIRHLLRESHFFDLEIPQENVFPDAVNYRILVEDLGQKKELNFHSGNMPKELEELVSYLSDKASYK